MFELSNVKKKYFLLNESHFIQEVLEVFRIFFKTNYTIRLRLPFDIKEENSLEIIWYLCQVYPHFRGAYTASKHAVAAWCDSLRAELAGSGVGVTVISPGYVNTNLSRNALTSSGRRVQ